MDHGTSGDEWERMRERLRSLFLRVSLEQAENHLLAPPLTGFLPVTTCLRTGTGLLADISIGLEDTSRCCKEDVGVSGRVRGHRKRPILSRLLPVFVLTLLPPLVRADATTPATTTTVSYLVVDFGSDSVLQLQYVLKGHVGEF